MTWCTKCSFCILIDQFMRPSDGALTMWKPDTVWLPQPSSLHQLLRPGETEKAELTAVGRPLCCQLSASSDWLGPFISAELFCGWEETLPQRGSGKPTFLGQLPEREWKPKKSNMEPLTFRILTQSISEGSMPLARTCSKSPGLSHWPVEPMNNGWGRT